MPDLHRFTLPLVLLLLPVVTDCDPVDEGPPPATAATAQGTETPPPAPPPPEPAGPAEGAPPPRGPSPAAGADTSGEYAVGADTDTYEDNDPSALTDFRPALDPYGAWVDDPTYGTIWVPAASAVGADFQPYVSAGHWTYGDADDEANQEGWTWVSDYAWGWAPFHYGRWVFIEGRGWSWVPGRAYRGAWVDWSVDDGYGYLGWGPAPPLFLWFGGAPFGWGRGYLAHHWVYCPRAAVFAPAVATHVVAGPAAVALSARMRLYVPVAGRAAGGPPPARLGYTAAQVPHPPSDPQSPFVRAPQFARPSSAQALGAHAPAAPVRIVAPTAMPHASFSTPERPGPPPGSVGRTPPLSPGAASPGAASPGRPAPQTPSYGGGRTRTGGGGGHRR